MGFAWCIMFGIRWACVIVPFVNLEEMLGIVELSVALSFVCALCVFFLDTVDDIFKRGGASQAGSLATTALINAIALLIGFTWEKSFDHGVLAVSTVSSHPESVRTVLAILVCCVLIRPWRRYLLAKVMYLEARKKARMRTAFTKYAPADRSYAAMPVSDTSASPEGILREWQLRISP